MRNYDSIIHKLIQSKAHEIWMKRQLRGEKGNSDTDWHQATEYFKKHQRIIPLFIFVYNLEKSRLYKFIKPFIIKIAKITDFRRRMEKSSRFPLKIRVIFLCILCLSLPLILIEKLVTEPIAKLISRTDIFQILEKFGFALAIIIFISEFPQRSEKSIYEAWGIVQDGQNQKSGVVRLALERLHKEKFTLSGLNLKGSNLNGINLSCKKIPCADFSKADLRGVDFSKADLSGVNFSDANLSNANLSSAKLNQTNFSNANLSGANLKNASLENARLSDANLSSTDLRSANFAFAILWGADLQEAILWNANLKKVQFFGAYFNDADFTDAKGLTLEQIKDAINWDTAIYDEKLNQVLFK